MNIGSQPGSTRALVVSPSTQRFFSFTFDYFLRFFFLKTYYIVGDFPGHDIDILH